MRKDIDEIDMAVTEVDGIVELLIFVAEEAEPDQRRRLQGPIISLLHIAHARLLEAMRAISALSRAKPHQPNHAP